MRTSAAGALLVLTVLCSWTVQAAEFSLLDGDDLALGVEVGAEARTLTRWATDIPVDARRTELRTPLAVELRVRLNASADGRYTLGDLPITVLAEVEGDVYSGWVRRSVSPEGQALPAAAGPRDTLRTGNLRVSLAPWFHVSYGRTVSHWGLGLLANDGRDPEAPGVPGVGKRGDRVLRGSVATGPYGPMGLRGAVFLDSDVHDDTTVAGDVTEQFGAAVLLGREGETWGGLYTARRRQEGAGGGELFVTVYDATGGATLELDTGRLAIGGELAIASGTTTLGATTDRPELDVLQLGGVVRASYDAGVAGVGFDGLYASGDPNPDDGSQNALRADSNLHMGLVLYPLVIAGMSGRAVATAGDPDLVGVPARDLSRVPTRGGVTNSRVLSPRVFTRPAEGLELYAAALFAWTDAAVFDPRNARLAGGLPRNALDRTPGSYWGTELDVGAVGTLIAGGLELGLRVEAGVLLPGSALRGLGTQSVVQTSLTGEF